MKTQMFCTECSAVIDEDTKFCPECGAKIEDLESNEYDNVFCPSCGIATTTEFDFCPDCGKSISQEYGENSIATDTLKKKKFTLPVKPLHIGIAAAVVFLIAMVSILSGNSGSKDGNNIIYAKDKELQYTYMPKLKTFEMTDRLIDSSYNFGTEGYMLLSDYILTSDDGRYIFYPDRKDDGFTYYWRDLKADNSKNDMAVKIDGDIGERPFLTSDGSKLFYIKNDDQRLYVFDRKSGEKKKLDDDVSNFYVNETGSYIIYDKYSDNEYSTYEMTIKGLTGEKNKIDSNAQVYEAFANDKKVYYLKDRTLYIKEFGKEKIKIASDVNNIVSIIEGKFVYYLKTEEVTNKLSAFINDDMAANDRDLMAPVEEPMAPEPAYPYESDYQEKFWYASSWGRDFNSETNEYGYWQQETDYEAYSTAYEEYEKKYEEWEIKYDEIMDKYNESYAIYRGKESRDDLRLAFDDGDNEITYEKYSLYYWNNGTENLVASDLAMGDNYQYYLAASFRKPVVLYQKYNTSTGGTQKMSDIMDEVGSYFYEDSVIRDMQNRLAATRNISEEIYVASGNKESVLDANEGNNWSINEKGSIYFLDNYNMDKSYGTLMSASIKDGVVEKPVKVDEDVMIFYPGNDNGNHYYFKSIKNHAGDLYLNGKVIASDVYIPYFYNYSGTDTLIYYTDFSANNSNGTLCTLKGGKQTKIADDVSFFSPIDEMNITYLTDFNQNREKGDLMLYNGGSKPVLVDSDVNALLWNSRMMWSIYY